MPYKRDCYICEKPIRANKNFGFIYILSSDKQNQYKKAVHLGCKLSKMKEQPPAGFKQF